MVVAFMVLVLAVFCIWYSNFGGPSKLLFTLGLLLLMMVPVESFQEGSGNPKWLQGPERNVVYCRAAAVDGDKYLIRDMAKNKLYFFESEVAIPDGCFVSEWSGYMPVAVGHDYRGKVIGIPVPANAK